MVDWALKHNYLPTYLQCRPTSLPVLLCGPLRRNLSRSQDLSLCRSALFPFYFVDQFYGSCSLSTREPVRQDFSSDGPSPLPVLLCVPIVRNLFIKHYKTCSSRPFLSRSSSLPLLLCGPIVRNLFIKHYKTCSSRPFLSRSSSRPLLLCGPIVRNLFVKHYGACPPRPLLCRVQFCSCSALWPNCTKPVRKALRTKH